MSLGVPTLQAGETFGMLMGLITVRFRDLFGQYD